MPQTLGAHSPRVADVAKLLTRRGRIDRPALAFEGATLLDEALRSGVEVRELFVTAQGFATTPAAQTLETASVPVYLVDDRTFAKISDVEAPSGVLAVCDLRFASLDDMFAAPGVVIVSADLNDPGNVGTLLRSADAFGATGVVLGGLGVDPFHPKLVRAAMGAIFRLKLAIAEPAGLAAAAAKAQAGVVGLTAGGDGLEALGRSERLALVVGHERHGLGRWEAVCAHRAGIPMPGDAESLNAGVAGSIALYEWNRSRAR